MLSVDKARALIELEQDLKSSIITDQSGLNYLKSAENLLNKGYLKTSNNAVLLTLEQYKLMCDKADTLEKLLTLNGSDPQKVPHRKKAVVCVETGVRYESASEAARVTGISRCVIVGCCLGLKNRKTAGGYHWKYI